MKSKLTLFTLLAVGIFTQQAIAQQWAADLPTNVYVAFQTARASAASRDGFLAPNGINPGNGTTIHLWDMNGNEPAMPHRLFQLVHLGEGWYQIRNNIHGVLDLPNYRNENGLQMILYEQNNAFNGQHQRFRIARVGNGLYQIYTSHGRNLHVWNSQTVNGTPVVTWTGSHTDTNQNAIWRIYTIDNQSRLTQWTEGQESSAQEPFERITYLIDKCLSLLDKPVPPEFQLLEPNFYMNNERIGVYTRNNSIYISTANITTVPDEEVINLVYVSTLSLLMQRYNFIDPRNSGNSVILNRNNLFATISVQRFNEFFVLIFGFSENVLTF